MPLRNETLAAPVEHIDLVVHFDALINHTGHEVGPVGRPLDPNRAV